MGFAESEFKDVIGKMRKKGMVKGIEEAFIEFPYQEEAHAGDLNYFTQGKKAEKMDYKRGDIVFASRYNYPDGGIGNRHLFVVIGVNADDIEVVSEEYLSLIISSKRQKGNDVSHFIYNEPLDKSDVNHLNVDSIVKCDAVFVIKESNIQRKIGEVTDEELSKYFELMKKAAE